MEQAKLKELFDSLTLDEKIGQLVQLNGNFFDSNEKVATGPVAKIGIDKDKIYQTGSILNTMGAKELKKLQDRYLEKNEKKIPMLFMADIINGFKTIFPIPLGLGCTFNPELVKKTAQVAAKEAAVSGIHITFSPMVDMVRDARWGRVMESYGEDNYLNCAYAKAMVEGYQGNGDKYETILSCVKHFAGYGAPVAGRDYNTVELGERSLRQDYLPSYKAAVDAGCRLVMTSFNTIDGIPVTANDWLLRDILRDEWGFDGVVISDHSAVKELVPHGIAKDGKEAAKLALEAGCDIDMMTATYSNHLATLVKEGKLDEKYIDEAAMRVLELKNELGLFEDPYRGANEELEKEFVLCDEFRKIAREVVWQTCVLLKNDTILPLNKSQKIAVVGPYASNKNLSGMWSINVDREKVVTIYDGLKKQADENCVTFAKGSPLLDDASMFESFGYSKNVGELVSDNIEEDRQKALEVAKGADVVIVAIGEHSHQSGEGGSRGDITLPRVQIELLKEVKKLNKPIVTLVFSGRPLALDEVSQYSDALLQCWFPGTEGGDGIADIIYGKVNPSARLAMTFPYSVGQCPIYYNEMSTGRPAKTSSHSKRFTSRYIDIPNEPTYCFGYGLTYSEFKYSEVELDKQVLTPDSKIKASVVVENTSERQGVETVQLYIRDLFGSVVRPVKELKGVQKITLQPHEAKKVEFEISEEMLKFIRKDMHFDSEAGDFEVFIGKDSNTENKANFELKK
ncbi:beta-glucosidase BglX [Thomasclavelia sp.]|uniref:beta-glucosidase BglX n=1 Tax=Thomasclavelia sp. TaxID=3025757 RepID=UPI0025D39985|nr:beta-glucosidase BglX [Thomasclavelia sp.]